MKEIKRYYRVRSKICNTGVIMLLICLFMSLLCCYEPKYLPVFIFALTICILTLIPAFYVEVIEKEIKNGLD